MGFGAGQQCSAAMHAINAQMGERWAAVAAAVHVFTDASEADRQSGRVMFPAQMRHLCLWPNTQREQALSGSTTFVRKRPRTLLRKGARGQMLRQGRPLKSGASP